MDNEEFYDNGLDESGIPYEYSSAGGYCEMPQFLFDQLGKLGSVLAVEIFSPKCVEKVEQKPAKGIPQKRTPTVCCPSCGVSQEDVTATQKAGCAKCYQVFDSILVQKYRRFSDGKHYCGKGYEPKIIWSDIDYLQNELSVAVKDQNFERAARLRDEMLKLKKKASVE